MMTEKRKNKNKIWYWSGGVILVVALVVVAMVVSGRFDGEKNIEKPEVAPVVQEEKKEEPEKKEDEKVEEVKEETEEVVKEEAVQYDGEDPNENGELSGVITYAGVVNDKLMIRVNIDQYLEDGTCSLVIRRNGGVIYSDAAGIQGGAMTSTCEGFDVLVSELATGEAEIEIRLNANDKTGIIEGKVEI